MRSILVLNAKGGCGKTTLATNLAAYYAARGQKVALVDLDPLGSSIDWLDSRPGKRPPIIGVAGWKGQARVPRTVEVAVYDAPAKVHGSELSDLVRRAQSLLMPVLPSPIDLRAAARFSEELLGLGRVGNRKIKVATVINRARENSPGRFALEDFLRGLKMSDGRRLPFVGVLRASQNYVRAAERGLGIFELGPSSVAHDLELWRPITRWLNSKASLPN
jgi:chromosome partitioning protein